LSGMLSEGRRIIQKSAGAAPEGFRAPCAAVCPNLLKAEIIEGYIYDSSVMMQKTAWDMLNGKYVKPRAITKEIFDSLQIEEGIMVIPGAGEYTWYLNKSAYPSFLELAKHDFRQCLYAGIPFVSLSHVSPIQQTSALENSETGFDFYRELLKYARRYAEKKGFCFSSVTMAEACRRLQVAKRKKRG
jgi:hypothetical protein